MSATAEYGIVVDHPLPQIAPHNVETCRYGTATPVQGRAAAVHCRPPSGVSQPGAQGAHRDGESRMANGGYYDPDLYGQRE